MSKDTIATTSAVCTKTPNIPLLVAPFDNDRQDDRPGRYCLPQNELEAHLLAAPAANWREAADKARYLLNLFAGTAGAQDPRTQKLIAAVLTDFKRLSEGEAGEG